MTLVNKDTWITTRNRDIHSGYRFSTSDKNNPHVIYLRKNAAYWNEVRRRNAKLKGTDPDVITVRLMPRGSRVGPSLKDYGNRRSYDSYLPMKYGTHYDVYVYDTKDWSRWTSYSRGFDDGMAKAKQDMINKLDNTIDALKGLQNATE